MGVAGAGHEMEEVNTHLCGQTNVLISEHVAP